MLVVLPSAHDRDSTSSSSALSSQTLCGARRGIARSRGAASRSRGSRSAPSDSLAPLLRVARCPAKASTAMLPISQGSTDAGRPTRRHSSCRPFCRRLMVDVNEEGTEAVAATAVMFAQMRGLNAAAQARSFQCSAPITRSFSPSATKRAARSCSSAESPASSSMSRRSAQGERDEFDADGLPEFLWPCRGADVDVTRRPGVASPGTVSLWYGVAHGGDGAHAGNPSGDRPHRRRAGARAPQSPHHGVLSPALT